MAVHGSSAQEIEADERAEAAAAIAPGGIVAEPAAPAVTDERRPGEEDGSVAGDASPPSDTVPTDDGEQETSQGRARDLEALAAAPTNTPVHSAFSRKQKRFIIFMVAFAGFFSPLSANIYFPALNTISRDLRVSNELVNLTLTSYMIFQGLAPTLFGDLADMAGRRPAYIIGFIVYVAACIGIALQNSYAALFVLRCLQSTGSSGTIALGSGVVADIATSAERGTYMGWAQAGPMVGPALGPLLGGALAQFLGWRAIFWFLAVLAVVYLVPFVVTFPETGRNVVGDGSTPPQGWNMSLLNYLETREAAKERPALSRATRRESQRQAQADLAARRRLRWPNPLNTLHVVAEKDVGLLLLFNSLIYTAFYLVAASAPSLFHDIYGYNDLQIGLAFLPFGFGCFLAPLLNGRMLDRNYRRWARKKGIAVDKRRRDSLRDFPLERARIEVTAPLLVLGDAALLCYGWVLQAEPSVAAPLVLHFVMGVALTGAFNSLSIMLVDLYPLSPATATAANNLVRCLMGAAGTAVVVSMIEGMGRGWCFTFVAGVVAATSPILWVLVRWGPEWREARRVRMEERKREQEELEMKRRVRGHA